MLIDFHSHFYNTDSIVCNANASEPAQKPALLKCAGLLPDLWTPERQNQLFDLLNTEESLQLGEVGLDKRFEGILPMDQQVAVLRQELEFAISKDRSISLHCVHATKPMLDLLADLSFRPYSILWHGFSGSNETAAQLARLKVIISIGPRYKGDVLQLIRANPYTVPETDYEGSDVAGHQKILKNQYLRFPENHSEKAMEIFNSFSKEC